MVSKLRSARSIAVIALAATLGATALALHSLRDRQAAAGPLPSPGTAMEVPVASVVQETVPVYLEYLGTTQAVRSVTLEAQVTGYLERYAVRDGEDVRKGRLLYQIDPRAYRAALAQARAQLERDAAAYRYAAANHARDSRLIKTGDVSLDTLQLAASTAAQDAASVAADRAAIETAQLNLGYTSIRAPFSGRLSLTQVHEGALITVAGTQLNTLVQLDPIYATFNPPDTDLPRIETALRRGPLPARVLIGNSTTAEYSGTVTFIDNTVNSGTGTITMRATIANPRHSLLPGQFIRVRLTIAARANALLIPQIAVSSSQLGQYVYVVGPDSLVRQRFVTLGADYGPLVSVESGLAPGEWVATGSLLRLGSGMRVHPLRQTPAAAGTPGRAASKPHRPVRPDLQPRRGPAAVNGPRR
jgi:RND family efflux transporter MFP subunit